jgi:hypothetical protein
MNPKAVEHAFDNVLAELCGMRTVADASAVADPSTGLAVYDTFGYDGWLRVGGTSLAAPVVASVYAMGGTPKKPYASSLNATPGGLFDVVGGSNGQCQGTYVCNGSAGTVFAVFRRTRPSDLILEVTPPEGRLGQISCAVVSRSVRQIR